MKIKTRLKFKVGYFEYEVKEPYKDYDTTQLENDEGSKLWWCYCEKSKLSGSEIFSEYQINYYLNGEKHPK